MSGGIWLPTGDTPGIATIAGASVRHKCDFCPATFYDTGNNAEDDRRFLSHFEACWKQRGEDKVGEELEMRRDEPLSQTDTERVDWLRADAERRRDRSVKGVTGWDPRIPVRSK